MSTEAKNLLIQDVAYSVDESEHNNEAMDTNGHQIEATRTFAFDINHKINELHAELEQLTQGFKISRQTFSDSLQTLAARISTEAKQVTEQLRQSDEEKHALISELEARLRDTSAKNLILINELEKSFSVSDAEKRELISGLEQHLKQTEASIDDEISSIFQQLQNQQSDLNLLQQELDKSHQNLAGRIAQLSQTTGAQIEALVDADTRQEKTQKLFAEHLDELRAKSNATADDVYSLQTDLSEHKRKTTKLQKVAAGVAAAVTLTIAATMTYLHYSNAPVVAMLDARLAAFQADISDRFSSKVETDQAIMSLETTLAVLGDQVASHHSTTASESLALQESLSQVADKVAALELSLYGAPEEAGSLSTPALTIHNNDWIQAQNPEHYVIQLVGVYREGSVIGFTNRFAEQLAQFPLSANVSQYRGQNWYNLFYGSFATFAEAQQALDSLPMKVQRNSPWVRRMADVQSAGR
ncbi:MAG: hypothetical protein AseanaTS_19890 [Candidatus Pelagadaptatus aseana]|uniref:SPOR domain-containing protein n=1 Tax=Candidatus Pelagadaptatus aseana TaxID=3120508 RepID=UPI0039B35071